MFKLKAGIGMGTFCSPQTRRHTHTHTDTHARARAHSRTQTQEVMKLMETKISFDNDTFAGELTPLMRPDFHQHVSVQ